MSLRTEQRILAEDGLVITGNVSPTGAGAGIALSSGGGADVVQNLIAGNQVTGGGAPVGDAWETGGGIQLALGGGHTLLVNNTIAGNTAEGVYITTGGPSPDAGAVEVIGNIVNASPVPAGTTTKKKGKK